MAHLTERQLVELAAERGYGDNWGVALQILAARIASDDLITARQREIRRNIELFHLDYRGDTRTGHEHRPTGQYVSVKFSDWGFGGDTPANFVAEDPISFFGIKEDV